MELKLCRRTFRSAAACIFCCISLLSLLCVRGPQRHEKYKVVVDFPVKKRGPDREYYRTSKSTAEIVELCGRHDTLQYGTVFRLSEYSWQENKVCYTLNRCSMPPPGGQGGDGAVVGGAGSFCIALNRDGSMRSPLCPRRAYPELLERGPYS